MQEDKNLAITKSLIDLSENDLNFSTGLVALVSLLAEKDIITIEEYDKTAKEVRNNHPEKYEELNKARGVIAERERIDNLINKNIHGKATEEEQKEFKEMMKKDSQNMKDHPEQYDWGNIFGGMFGSIF